MVPDSTVGLRVDWRENPYEFAIASSCRGARRDCRRVSDWARRTTRGATLRAPSAEFGLTSRCAHSTRLDLARARSVSASRHLSRAPRARDARRVGDRRSSRFSFFARASGTGGEDALGAARSSDALGAGARLARPNARETSARRGDECDREGVLAARSRASTPAIEKRAPLEPRLMGCPIFNRGAEEGRRPARASSGAPVVVRARTRSARRVS